MKNKKTSLICALSLALMAMSTAASASVLQNKMDSVFGDMQNISQPGVFDSQRRGVITGGAIQVRNRIMNTQLISASMPSFEAGCGGLDLFGGSFSFINADQFIQLLRSIASNAKGYAFEAALKVASPEIHGIITHLQAVVQALNQLDANSCELAKGLVTDSMAAIMGKKDHEYYLEARAKGIKETYHNALRSLDGKSTAKEVYEKAPDVAKKMTGNIVWKELKTNHATAWFVGAANEDEEASVLMSFSGSLILQPPTDDNNGQTQHMTTHLDPTIKFKDLINGGEVEIWKCDEAEQCMKPTRQKVQIKGFYTMIYNSLMGNGVDTPGVIKKFSMAMDNAFTAKEANLVSNLPQNVGAALRILSTSSNETARSFASDVAYAVSAAWANQIMTEQLDAVTRAIRSNTNTETQKQLVDLIEQTKLTLRSDYEAFEREHITQSDLMKSYASLMSVIWQPNVWTK